MLLGQQTRPAQRAAAAAAASRAQAPPPSLPARRRRCSVTARAAAAAATVATPTPTLPSTRRHAPRRRTTTTTPKAAASAAAATTTNALIPLIAQAAPYALAAAAGIAFCSAAALALFPRSWRLTQAVARARWPLVPLSLAYAGLLAASWEPDTLSLMMPGSLKEGFNHGFAPQFFPTLDGVGALFARPYTAASFLVHVAVANLVAARAVFWDASARCVPAAHSILLCSVLGPVGVLAHELTKALGLRSRAAPVRLGGGSITLMPYQE